MRVSATVLVLSALFAAALASSVTYTLPGIDSFADDEWTVVSRADANDVITFRIALYQQNLDELDTLFWRISDPNDSMYMQYMNKEEVKGLVSPPLAVQGLVVSWALEQGAIAARSEGDYVIVSAPTHVVEAMLGDVELHVVQDAHSDEMDLKILSGSYSLPTHIARHVEFVQGLNHFVHKVRLGGFRHPHADSDTNASTDDLIPETLNNLYNLNNYVIGDDSNSTTCVAEFSKFSYLASDMTAFCDGVDVQQPKDIINVGPFNDKFADTECTLDIQYINGVALNAQSYFWTTNGWILDLAQELIADSSRPLVVSISWSSDERQDGAAYNYRCDTEMQQLGVLGVSILAASGDSGAVGTSKCNGNRHALNPGYPTTSPVVTSVGATMLVGEPEAYTGDASVCQLRQFTCADSGLEDPADENHGGYATGGGFSVYEDRPPYQDTVVTEYLNDASIPKPPASYYNATNRGFPDVGANGLNLLMYVNGRWTPVGGTSASTPIWGGIFAIMNDFLMQNNKPPIGFANPLIYQMFADSPSTFLNIGTLQTNNDDGCGSELGYTSNPNGWDPVTGLGTPNVGNILSYLQSQLTTMPDRV